MPFYAYKGQASLGQEPAGGDGKLLMLKVKSAQYALRTCRKVWRGQPFRLYWYTNFYDHRTFREIPTGGHYG